MPYSVPGRRPKRHVSASRGPQSPDARFLRLRRNHRRVERADPLDVQPRASPRCERRHPPPRLRRGRHPARQRAQQRHTELREAGRRARVGNRIGEADAHPVQHLEPEREHRAEHTHSTVSRAHVQMHVEVGRGGRPDARPPFDQRRRVEEEVPGNRPVARGPRDHHETRAVRIGVGEPRERLGRRRREQLLRIRGARKRLHLGVVTGFGYRDAVVAAAEPFDEVADRERSRCRDGARPHAPTVVLGGINHRQHRDPTECGPRSTSCHINEHDRQPLVEPKPGHPDRLRFPLQTA